ncbi:uncharacterized protein EV422DRAFT_494491 [Fimicolochytrium jonesii]|uniref:uncharacterized protein n=1 Tax=Fimicolochytrium jonesii TaxID=1396493 RepID=UPI0022FDC132|nr:uncharacterized protein EV422DRAFT_494491 [Fimicolochytrium jonesii]KAI8823066.1 hypothetical protein EV422DRAFT_494491 [Fimicolochytrium jonesii]
MNSSPIVSKSYSPLSKNTAKNASADVSKTLAPLKRIGHSLFTKGFIGGSFSDFTLEILGMTYNLHRIVLLHNEYFAAMLEGPWQEQGKQAVKIQVEDPNMTVEGVTITLGRIYGRTEVKLNGGNARSVLAAGLFFCDRELCDVAVDFILSDISPATVLEYLLFADRFCYGEHSEAITEECLLYLCREGFSRRSLRPVFEEMPIDWLERILSSDCFWIPSEQDRWSFIVDIINRRQRQRHMPPKNSHLPLGDTPALGMSESPEICVKQVAMASAAEMTNVEQSYDSQKNEEEFPDGGTYGELLCNSVAYEHIPFSILLQIRSLFEQHDTQCIDRHLIGDTLERAAWTQMKLQNLVVSASPETTQLGIKEPIVPESDTRHIDGWRLATLLNEPHVIEHDGSTFPPMRFSVEFHDLVQIASGEKVYSERFFYAGSMWQVYLQNVPRDEPAKLGVYLQRMAVNPEQLQNGGMSAPYVDRRQTTVTWFQLYCYFGSEFYVLESKPDLFQDTQSWGWKINKLHKSAFNGGRTLRCCVVLGHV